MIVRAVIFDMDGLLLDTEAMALQAYEHTCHQVGIVYQKEVYLGCLGMNEQDGESYFRERLVKYTDADDFIRIWSKRYHTLKKTVAPGLKTGVLNLLAELGAREIPAAVATSSSMSTATELLTRSGIINNFKTLVSGDQIENGKPAPDIYIEAANRLGVTPPHCLALEDSDNGVRSAFNAGMSVIQVPDLAEPKHGLGTGVTQMRSLLDVIDLLPAAGQEGLQS